MGHIGNLIKYRLILQPYIPCILNSIICFEPGEVSTLKAQINSIFIDDVMTGGILSKIQFNQTYLLVKIYYK